MAGSKKTVKKLHRSKGSNLTFYTNPTTNAKEKVAGKNILHGKNSPQFLVVIIKHLSCAVRDTDRELYLAPQMP